MTLGNSCRRQLVSSHPDNRCEPSTAFKRRPESAQMELKVRTDEVWREEEHILIGARAGCRRTG